MAKIPLIMLGLGTRRPRFYLFCYLATIMVFAGLFWLIRADFYHPYARYEDSMLSEEQSLRVSLSLALRRAAREGPSLYPGTSIDIDSIRVGKIDTEDDHLVIQVGMTMAAGPPELHSQLYTSTVMKLPPVAIAEKNESGPPALMMFPQFLDPNVTLYIPKAADRTVEPTTVSLRPVFMRIYVSQDDVDRLRSFTGGRAGFPHRVPNSFGRLLYLSVVTITTVGYGDIVPLTDRARTLCGLEATLGIVLLGLFIGSVSSVKAEKVSKKTQVSLEPRLTPARSSEPTPAESRRLLQHLP